MAFNHGDRQGLQRVEKGDRGVAVAGGVDHQGAGRGSRLLHPVDQLTLVVGLPEHHLSPLGGRLRLAERLNVLESRMPIDVRLARSKQVEVGTVQDVDRFGHASRHAKSAVLYRRASSVTSSRPGTRFGIGDAAHHQRRGAGDPRPEASRPSSRSWGWIRARSPSNATWRSCRARCTRTRRSPTATGSRSCSSSEAAEMDGAQNASPQARRFADGGRGHLDGRRPHLPLAPDRRHRASTRTMRSTPPPPRRRARRSSPSRCGG